MVLRIFVPHDVCQALDIARSQTFWDLETDFPTKLVHGAVFHDDDGVHRATSDSRSVEDVRDSLVSTTSILPSWDCDELLFFSFPHASHCGVVRSLGRVEGGARVCSLSYLANSHAMDWDVSRHSAPIPLREFFLRVFRIQAANRQSSTMPCGVDVLQNMVSGDAGSDVWFARAFMLALYNLHTTGIL
jgi:hypothetical protein